MQIISIIRYQLLQQKKNNFTFCPGRSRQIFSRTYKQNSRTFQDVATLYNSMLGCLPDHFVAVLGVWSNRGLHFSWGNNRLRTLRNDWALCIRPLNCFKTWKIWLQGLSAKLMIHWVNTDVNFAIFIPCQEIIFYTKLHTSSHHGWLCMWSVKITTFHDMLH